MTEPARTNETEIIVTPQMIDYHVRRGRALRNAAIRAAFSRAFRWIRSRSAPVAANPEPTVARADG